MEQARINGATPEIIGEWFNWLQIDEVAAVKPENRWNMDEAGIMEGMGSNGLVLGCRGSRGVVRKMPGNKAWTSFIECISATGEALPPLVIFKAKTVQQQWFPTQMEDYPLWSFYFSENGWTTNDIALSWLREVYLKRSKPKDPNEWRLLIFDGHGSHETPEFMWECFQNKVLLVWLPPHTSHVLQPLDLAVFSSMKKAYRREVGEVSQWNDSTVLGKRLFLKAYKEARFAALTVKNIKAGWVASGLWPLCPHKPLTSPLLLVNSTASSTGLVNSKEEAWEDIQPITPIRAMEKLSLATPINSEELKARLHYLQGSKRLTRSVRRVQRQVVRMWNRETFQRAISDRKAEGLKAKIEEMKPRKKKKVDIGPNHRFATIREIQKAQIAAGTVVEGRILESDDDIASNDPFCIVVQTRAAKRKAGRE
jgi:4-hydroxybenzoate polyprenyltransferase